MSKAVIEKLNERIFDSLSEYVYLYYGETADDACYDLQNLAAFIARDLSEFLKEAA